MVRPGVAFSHSASEGDGEQPVGQLRTASVAAQVAGTSKGYVPVGGFGPGAAPPQIGVMLVGPMMESLDTDRDEQLSRDEWIAVARRLFEACEKDGDGKVDLKSFTAGLTKLLPAPPEGGPPGGFNMAGFMAGPIFTRADEKKAGKQQRRHRPLHYAYLVTLTAWRTRPD